METPMRIATLLLTLAGVSLGGPGGDRKLPLLFQDDFEHGASHWRATDPKAWKILQTERGKIYSLYRQSDYKPPYRSPLNFESELTNPKQKQNKL